MGPAPRSQGVRAETEEEARRQAWKEGARTAGPGLPQGGTKHLPLRPEKKSPFLCEECSSACLGRRYFITFRNQVLIVLQQFRWEVA